MNFLVVTAASKPSKLMGKYLAHMETANIPHHVYLGDGNGYGDGRMGMCLSQWREIAEKFAAYDRLILTDAWDVLMVSDRGTIEQRLEEMPNQVVFAAEQNCWPEPDLASMIEGQNAWRFANGGMLTASPKALLRFCDEAEKHQEYAPNTYNQQWLNRRLADRSFSVYIDRGTRLFYCMHSEKGQLQSKDGKLWNSVTDNYPSFIHFNGNWPWENVIRMLKEN